MSPSVTHLLKMQGRFSDCSETSRLRDYHPQVLVTLCAALSESEAPLDFIVTDGVTFDLFRFRENTGVLIYHDLSGTEVGACCVVRRVYVSAHVY